MLVLEDKTRNIFGLIYDPMRAKVRDLAGWQQAYMHNS